MSKEFYDLFVPYSALDLPNEIMHTLWLLGYTHVAQVNFLNLPADTNKPIKIQVPAPPPTTDWCYNAKYDTLRLSKAINKPSGSLKLYSRLHISIEGVNQLHCLTSAPIRAYDIVSVEPLTEKAWNSLKQNQTLCNAFDIVSCDTNYKLPYIPKRTTIQHFIKCGLTFEIRYSPCLRNKIHLINTLTYSQNILRNDSKCDSIILSSNANIPLECRAPVDIISIAKLFGIKDHLAYDTINRNCKKVLLKSFTRTQCHKTMISSKLIDYVCNRNCILHEKNDDATSLSSALKRLEESEQYSESLLNISGPLKMRGEELLVSPFICKAKKSIALQKKQRNVLMDTQAIENQKEAIISETIHTSTESNISETIHTSTESNISETILNPTESNISDTILNPIESDISETILNPTESNISETIHTSTVSKISETILNPTESKISETILNPTDSKISETILNPREIRISETIHKSGELIDTQPIACKELTNSTKIPNTELVIGEVNNSSEDQSNMLSNLCSNIDMTGTKFSNDTESTVTINKKSKKRRISSKILSNKIRKLENDLN